MDQRTSLMQRLAFVSAPALILGACSIARVHSRGIRGHSPMVQAASLPGHGRHVGSVAFCWLFLRVRFETRQQA